MYNHSVHKNSLEIGQEFQDFIIENLSKSCGLTVSIYQSKKYQFEVGESLQGVEIKYDARSTGDSTYVDCKSSGNVAIEVAEKSNVSKASFTPSGIFRRDNSWLYIVGNYHQAWIFGKRTLIRAHESNKFRCINTLPTLQTMLIPIKYADLICEKKLIF